MKAAKVGAVKVTVVRQTKAGKAVKQLKTKQRSIIQNRSRNAHAVVKHDLSVRTYSMLCELDAAKGYEMSADYMSDKACRARFPSLARSKLRLCSANHRPGYWSNLPCDWPSTAWAYSEQETEKGPRTFVHVVADVEPLVNHPISNGAHCWEVRVGPDSKYIWKKNHLTSIGDPIVVIGRVVRSSYLHNGISYTAKMTFLYWITMNICTTGKIW